jgi:1,4-dihydroxy-2-naphthoate octaprenyltransferase
MTQPTARAGERHPREPTGSSFGTRAEAYFFATRPAFLSVTLVGALIGVASAYYDIGSINLAAAIPTLLFALVAHAGVNVLNDYYDHLNGTDAANVERIFPFTGGSRFIQNGVLSARETARLGYALLAAVVPAGLLLTAWAGPGLLVIGLAGLSIGWAYSAPPLELNSRGLGEACVGAGFALIVVGADYVQRHGFDSTPFAAGFPYALFVTNLLYINQFPDRKADLHAGKLHWVARVQPRVARWGYVLIVDPRRLRSPRVAQVRRRAEQARPRYQGNDNGCPYARRPPRLRAAPVALRAGWQHQRSGLPAVSSRPTMTSRLTIPTAIK